MAIFKLECNQWDSDDLRPYLEQAEAKAVETGRLSDLIEGYKKLAQKHQELASYWSKGSVTDPGGAKYHRKLANKYMKIANSHKVK